MEGTLHVIEVEDTKFKGFFKKLCCFAKRCRRKKSNDAVYRHIEYRPVIDAVVLSGYKLPNLPPGKVLSTAPDAGWEWPQHVPIFEIVRKYKRSQLTRKRTPQVLGSLSRFPSDPCLAESLSKAQSKPSLTFSVFYDHQVRTLTVHLQSGNNLSSSGSKLTKAHLYVTVSLLPLKNEIAKTRPMKGNVPDPTFDEKFQFTGFAHNDVLQQTLVLRVYFGSHYALLRNFVGAIELPLRQSHLYGYRMTKELTEQVDDFMVRMDVYYNRNGQSNYHYGDIFEIYRGFAYIYYTHPYTTNVSM